MKNPHRYSSGYTLIELIVFIVAVSILAAGFSIALRQVVQFNTNPGLANQALQLAQARMELIIGQRQQQGYSSFTDPCAGGSPPAACTIPSNFGITATISAFTLGIDNQFQEIIVTVTGASRAQVRRLVANDV